MGTSGQNGIALRDQWTNAENIGYKTEDFIFFSSFLNVDLLAHSALTDFYIYLESDVEKTYNAPFVKCLGYKGADKVNSSKFSDSFHSKLYLGKNHDIPTKWKITLDRALQRQR